MSGNHPTTTYIAIKYIIKTRQEQKTVAIQTGTSDTSSATAADQYLGYTGPTSFGSGSSSDTASTSSGDFVSLAPTDSESLWVPSQYVSDSPLSSTATWDNATLASLGVTVGTYVWTWGSGADQSFTLDVGASTPPPTVPEPGSVALFAAGLLGLALLRWRRAA